MINQHFYIARLIARYLSDEIEEEEQAELTRWRNESPENERPFSGNLQGREHKAEYAEAANFPYRGRMGGSAKKNPTPSVQTSDTEYM